MHTFAFGPFLLTPERQLLLEGSAPVRIGRRALDVLTALVQRPGDVVSKHELMAIAWPDMVVEEGNLKVNIAALRRALDDSSEQPRYIATVVGRGYRFIASVRSAHAPERAAVEVPPRRASNVPLAAPRIFGRATTIATILRDFESARLVSIVGQGGVGKTTVALAVAHEVADSFADGVWFVDLATVHDEAGIAEAVATAIGLPHPPAHALAALHAHLRDRKALLILDNCEHIIDGVANCAHQIMIHTRRTQLLATSRESLCVPGERVRRVSGLSTPPASGHLRASVAAEFAAVQLFVDCATRKHPAFELHDANASEVAEICRRVDGVALAIECVAMRVDTLEVRRLTEYIDRRFHMFDSARAGVERHRTIAAAIHWSYNLLSTSEQTVMRRLATFAGAFTLGSACAVGGDDEIGPARVVDDVACLTAKSLLFTEARNGRMDFRQTNLVRAFALEKLVERGELGDARRRHAKHFLALAEQAAAEHDALPEPAWAARYDNHVDDIRCALAWVANRPLPGGTPTLATRQFWTDHALTTEIRR